jgi:pentatricopeptide repeat protein
MKRQFAYILESASSNPAVDHAAIETASGVKHFVTVRDFDEAVETVKRMQDEGCFNYETCGAFGEAGVRRLIELTGNKSVIGYTSYLPEQDELRAQQRKQRAQAK